MISYHCWNVVREDFCQDILTHICMFEWTRQRSEYHESRFVCLLFSWTFGSTINYCFIHLFATLFLKNAFLDFLTFESVWNNSRDSWSLLLSLNPSTGLVLVYPWDSSIIRYFRLSSTYKISAMWMINENEIFCVH